MFGNLDYYQDKNRLKNNISYYNTLKKTILSNTNCLYDIEKKIWVGGNSTDKAIVNYLGESLYKVKKIKEVPFDSKNKYSYTKVIEDNKILNSYLFDTISVKVSNESLFYYKGSKYSVPIKFINHTLNLREENNKLYVYYNKLQQ